VCVCARAHARRESYQHKIEVSVYTVVHIGVHNISCIEISITGTRDL